MRAQYLCPAASCAYVPALAEMIGVSGSQTVFYGTCQPGARWLPGWRMERAASGEWGSDTYPIMSPIESPTLLARSQFFCTIVSPSPVGGGVRCLRTHWGNPRIGESCSLTPSTSVLSPVGNVPGPPHTVPAVRRSPALGKADLRQADTVVLWLPPPEGAAQRSLAERSLHLGQQFRISCTATSRGCGDEVSPSPAAGELVAGALISPTLLRREPRLCVGTGHWLLRSARCRRCRCSPSWGAREPGAPVVPTGLDPG